VSVGLQRGRKAIQRVKVVIGVYGTRASLLAASLVQPWPVPHHHWCAGVARRRLSRTSSMPYNGRTQQKRWNRGCVGPGCLRHERTYRLAAVVRFPGWPGVVCPATVPSRLKSVASGATNANHNRSQPAPLAGTDRSEPRMRATSPRSCGLPARRSPTARTASFRRCGERTLRARHRDKKRTDDSVTDFIRISGTLTNRTWSAVHQSCAGNATDATERATRLKNTPWPTAAAMHSLNSRATWDSGHTRGSQGRCPRRLYRSE